MSGTGTTRETSLQTWVEVLAKAAALIFGLTYAAGFVVLAIHHASFGIPEISFFQPRVFSAGFVLIFLVSLPCLTIARAHALFDMTASVGFRIYAKPESQRTLDGILLLNALTVSYGLALMCSFLIEHDPIARLKASPVILVPAGLFLLGIFSYRRWIDTKPTVCIIIAAAQWVAQLALLLLLEVKELLWLTLWFYGIGLLFLFFYKSWKIAQDGRSHEWEKYFLWVFAGAIVPFVIFIYPTIKPEYGGGRSTPAVLYLSNSVPIGNTKCVKAEIVEETDHGYYVTREKNKKGAYFIRRDQISMIAFGGSLIKETNCE